jgi:uncharacterized protein (DUF58 family)
MTDGAPAGGWRPTASLTRASLASTAFTVAAILTGRPDLLVLAAPLAVHAVAALVRRPNALPTVSSRLGTGSVREGEGTLLHVDLAPAAEVEHATLAVTLRRWVATRPPSGAVSRLSRPGEPTLHLQLPLTVLRWGRRPVGDGLLAVTSGWAGYQWGPVPLPPRTLTTVPLPGAFDSVAASPHPIGLVGAHPARRRGDGFELDSIRPFHPGDRLRRVHWRVSLRTGALHVTSSLAEEDSSVLLVVDSGVEVGTSGGVHGAASSLDLAVRAAGAVAEHHLVRGDRVGVRVLGSSGPDVLATAAGRAHLRRVLDLLARVVPGRSREVDPGRLRFRVSPGTTVLVFSPMLSQESVAATSALAARGLDVIVVDCLPHDPALPTADPRRTIAWRMRLIEREALLGRVRRTGVPVIRWRGPGTLDDVLRQLRRRASRTTAVRR